MEDSINNPLAGYGKDVCEKVHRSLPIENSKDQEELLRSFSLIAPVDVASNEKRAELRKSSDLKA